MKKKGYNRLNYLKHCKIVIDIVNAHYKAGYTTYAGVFRTFVKPFYPMTYKSFMKIMNMPNVSGQIEDIERRQVDTEAENENPNQLDLFN